jgi:tetratricopeptide (TPR) repeat protein
MPRERTPKQALSDAAGAITRGQLSMATKIIDQALAAVPPPEIAAELLTMAGVIADERGTRSLAISNYEQAISLFEEAEQPNPLKVAEALSMLADALVRSDPAQARVHVQRAVGLYDSMEGSHLRDKKAAQQHVAAVAQLAMLHELANDLDTARHYYEQGLALCDTARIRSGRVRELLREGLAGVRAAEDDGSNR